MTRLCIIAPMNPIRLLKDLVLALHGGGEPRHIAAGFALGATLGLVPKGNLFAAIFFLLFFILRVDKRAAFFSAALFTPLAYALDGAAHALGWALLKAGPLQGLWTALYGMPIVPLTRFNNTVVLGNLVIGLALLAPLYFAFLKLVELYGIHLKDRVEALPLVKAVKGWSFWDMYRGWLR